MSSKKFEKAIVHFDGDSFFASIEQVMNYTLLGKPVVTGAERGAATSLSYEAKRRGANRGMSMKEIRALCPDVVFVPSSYLSYSIFAQRMYSIVRKFTPTVEEYSIDECFADITGLTDTYKMSYENIACMIKSELQKKLGVTFGVGLGPNKVLAKIASKHRKPNGFTYITEKNIEEFLENISIGKVWGIGSASSRLLHSLHVDTAKDFISKDSDWLMEHGISKPYKEIWAELQGFYIKELTLKEEEKDIGSIIKSHTFRPPSSERNMVFSELSKNIEAACGKARRYNVFARHIGFYLKTQEFTYTRMEISLSVATNTPEEIIRVVNENFEKVYTQGILYRATGISLRSLRRKEVLTESLFSEEIIEKKEESVFKAVDSLNMKYGKQTIFLGSSLRALNKKENKREENIKKKTLNLPFLGKVH